MKKWLGLLLIASTNVAYAQTSAQGPGMMSNVMLLAGFLFIFYFMLIRPQSKRAKEHQQLVNNVKKDDEVITNGGLLGKVLRVADQYIVISVAEGIEVKLQKQAVTTVLPNGTLKNI